MTGPIQVIGNWKMNGSLAQLSEFEDIGHMAQAFPALEIGICFPATLLASAAWVAGAAFVGAQDCHAAAGGSHTGGLSTALLKDAGATRVILGHSETRADTGESDAGIAAKVQAAAAGGLGVILCVGEDRATRDAGGALDHVVRQVAAALSGALMPERLCVAYEPLWSIGAAQPAGADQIAEMHAAIRAALCELPASRGLAVPILYGGSVNGGDAAGILGIEDVNGVLVGGASLSAEKFVPIIFAAACAGRIRTRATDRARQRAMQG